MLLGVISDSHDHLDWLKAGVQLLVGKGVGHIIHLGDFVAPFTAKCFAGVDLPRTLVFGNNDGERLGLVKSFGPIHVPPHGIELAGRSIFLMHEPYALNEAVMCQRHDFVLYGHTHEVVLRDEGRTRILNPGECCGWLTGRPTVATIDLSTRATTVYDLATGAVFARQA